jgi:hypothetical protein
VPSTTPQLPKQSDAHGRRRGGQSLSAHHILVVAGPQPSAAAPAPTDLADQLRGDAGRVSLLNCANTITDLVGHRVAGRPDLVIGMLPGRGPSWAAVRVAERLGSPLMVLVSHDGPPSWGEQGTFRRADRVVLTGEQLRGRVLQAGVRPDRIDLWDYVVPGAAGAFRQLARRTIQEFVVPEAAGASGG